MFVKSLVGMQMIMLVDMVGTRRLSITRLEKIFFLLILFSFQNWLIQLKKGIQKGYRKIKTETSFT